MANDIDQFPLYDSLVKSGGKMSDQWVNSMATFQQNLTSYLTSSGIFIPTITTTQRDALTGPSNGQMIYNTTLGAPQIFQEGIWKTFTTS